MSLPNGAAGAPAAIKKNIEYLEKFKRVILFFDNDAPGIEAAEKCASILTPGRCWIASAAPYKDASDFIKKQEEELLREAIYGAKAFRPDGIVQMSDMRELIQEKLVPGTPYPWKGLNKMLYGTRPGDLVTWCAGTGVGKSAIVSEMVLNLLEAGETCGILYLEEGIARAGKRLVGLAMNKPIHLEGTKYTSEEFDAAWKKTIGTDRLFAYDHFGSIEEETLLSLIRFMIKGCDCRHAVLDHISMGVSGADLEQDERRALDHIMTGLRTMTQETGARIHVVSHLSRPSGSGRSHEQGRAVSLHHLRGTQAIAQLSDAVIAAERDQQSKDEEEKNTTQLRVLKNRYSGITGPAGTLLYDINTGRLREAERGEQNGDNKPDW